MPQYNFNGHCLHQESSMVYPLGMLQGIGLIETMRYAQGQLHYSAAHHKRLVEGLRQLGLPTKLWTSTFFLSEIAKVTANNPETQLRVRLQTGPDDKGNLWWLISAKPLTKIRRTLRLTIAKQAIKSAHKLSALKSAERQCYFLAAREAQTRAADDALLLNQHGRIVESTIANVFWIKKGQLFTTPLSEGCVQGIFRQHLLELQDVTEQALLPQDLLQADEVFLGNALRGIIPVQEIDGTTFMTQQGFILQAGFITE